MDRQGSVTSAKESSSSGRDAKQNRRFGRHARFERAELTQSRRKRPEFRRGEVAARCDEQSRATAAGDTGPNPCRNRRAVDPDHPARAPRTGEAMWARARAEVMKEEVVAGDNRARHTVFARASEPARWMPNGPLDRATRASEKDPEADARRSRSRRSRHEQSSRRPEPADTPSYQQQAGLVRPGSVGVEGVAWVRLWRAVLGAGIPTAHECPIPFEYRRSGRGCEMSYGEGASRRQNSECSWRRV